MSPELVGIQPRELKFTFELKKRSSCSVQLVNNSDEYVAFKVKTTSPKRYSVRPNTGIIPPKATCDFTVMMQAQKVSPPDMQCKDKFLVQSTVVPSGTTLEEITSDMFSRENGRIVEENKLKVVLISPPHSPSCSPPHSRSCSPPHSPVLQPINGALRQEPTYNASKIKDQIPTWVENVSLSHIVSKDVDELKYDLGEAEKTITKLREERSTIIQQTETLHRELALVKMRKSATVQVGYPFLFVCFIGLIGATLGYLLRS